MLESGVISSFQPCTLQSHAKAWHIPTARMINMVAPRALSYARAELLQAADVQQRVRNTQPQGDSSVAEPGSISDAIF